ncbi:hypothetical protein BOX15_Mlig026686g4, partial [Macrostomum lignano]
KSRRSAASASRRHRQAEPWGHAGDVKSRRGQTAATHVFSGMSFALSKHEPRRTRLADCIRRHGGAVVAVNDFSRRYQSDPPNIDFFVQSYNCEFDDKFNEAIGARSDNTVPADYVLQCAARGRLLDVRLHALGWLGEDGDDREDSALAACLASLLPAWPRPLPNLLESQCQPQCYAEFLDFPDRFQRGESPSVLRLIRIRQLGESGQVAANSDLVEFLRASTGCSVVFGSGSGSSGRDCLLTWRPAGKSLARLRVGQYDYDIGLRRRGGRAYLEAMDLIAALSDAVHNPSTESVTVALLSNGLFERAISEPIYGRGTGDRCCVVSTASAASLDSAVDPMMSRHHLLGTSLHELLHCFGLDHCPYASCVLNAYSDDSGLLDEASLPALLICPVDLRKLCSIVSPDSANTVLLSGRRLPEYFDRLAALLSRLRLGANASLAEAMRDRAVAALEAIGEP